MHIAIFILILIINTIIINLSSVFALENHSPILNNATENEKLQDQDKENLFVLDNFQDNLSSFDKRLAINGNLTKALTDKGIALNDLGKYEEGYRIF